jgi:DNA-binding XRE family transcriptional regulator
MEHKKIKTEFGNASVHKSTGYYRITTRKEGNHDKHLHVLRLEKKIGRKLLPGECCHHIDENRLNNDESNLMLMTKGQHFGLHNTGRIFSEETKKLKSEQTTGENHPGTNLTNKDVQLIKRMLITGKLTQKRIGEFFGVKRHVITSINTGKSWNSVKIERFYDD